MEGLGLTEHYYSAKPMVGHDQHLIKVALRGKNFTFTTDAGVFSKKGVDYGSKVLIEAMQINRHDKILDVGCGYGPIGISAAAIADLGYATLLDVNERAVQLAHNNAVRNEIPNVKVMQSDLLEKVKGQQFDCILTNPPIRAGKETVHQIFQQAFDCLTDQGSLWVVIQKKQGAPSAFKKLESIFKRVEEICKDKGYRIIRARK
jgi:16S rRNA (guanine1207-N2)-methyltransferase